MHLPLPQIRSSPSQLSRPDHLWGRARLPPAQTAHAPLISQGFVSVESILPKFGITKANCQKTPGHPHGPRAAGKKPSESHSPELIDFKILSSAAQTKGLTIAAPDVLPQKKTGRYDKSPDHDDASRDSEGVRKSLLGAVARSERRCS